MYKSLVQKIWIYSRESMSRSHPHFRVLSENFPDFFKSTFFRPNFAGFLYFMHGVLRTLKMIISLFKYFLVYLGGAK